GFSLARFSGAGSPGVEDGTESSLGGWRYHPSCELNAHEGAALMPQVAEQAVHVKQLFDLSGRVALITGGSIGLGRQMAEGLAEMGANIALCARKKERCLQAAEELKELGVKTLALGCDVKDPASVQAAVDETISKFGRIDVLINNAGISWGAPTETMSLADWNKVIETNLTG